MRVSRWRPECPECGYSLRGLTQSRCPECGASLPTTSRVYRRWAVHRIPWDRADRGFVFTAGMQTLLQAAFFPWRVGFRVALPDRWGRALCWMLANIALTVVAATLLGNGQYYVRWFAEWIHPSSFYHPALFSPPPAASRVLIWLAESLLAWAIVLLMLPLLGALLSLCMPGRHRAAKLAGAKASLYLSSVLIAALVVWYAYWFLFPPVIGTLFPPAFSSKMPPPPVPAWVLACGYAAAWAIAISANPFGPRRGIRPAMFLGLLYIGAWVLLTRVLLAGGPLEVLL